MKVNQLKSGVVLSYTQMILSNLISIIFTPIIIRILGQDEYGVMSLAGAVIGYLSLLNLGLGGSYNYFYHKRKKEANEDGIAKLNGMYITIFSVIALVVFIVGMVIVFNARFVLGNEITENELDIAKKLMFISVLSMAITLPSSVFGSYIFVHERFIFSRVVGIIFTILSNLVKLSLLFMGFRSVAITIGAFILTIINTLVTIIYSVKVLKFKFCFSGFQLNMLKSMFTFSFFIFLNQIVDQINWSIDKYIIARFYGAASVAVYSIGASLNNYYVTISSTISSVFSPRINKMVSMETDNKRLTDLMIKVGRIQFLVLSLVFSGLIFFGEYFIVGYYAGIGYEEAYKVVLILCAPVTIPLIQNVGIEIQRAKNKHRFRSIIYVIMAFLNLVISIPLCKHFGIIGCAIGTAIGITLANVIIMNIYYHKKLGLNMAMFWKSIFRILPSEIIPILFGIFILKVVKVESLSEFLLFGVLYVLVFSASVWCLGMNSFEKDLIREPVSRIYKKLFRKDVKS